MNILTVAVVTTPFSFEGRDRLNIAKRGLSNLEDKVDTLISVSNDKLSSIIDPKTSVKSAFEICDEALNQAVRGISDLITLPGIINIDFADVRSILKSSGSAIFGIGRAQGEDRAKKAIAAALNLSLIETPCSKAKGVLFNVSGGEDINLVEINEMADEIRRRVAPDAKIIFGAVQGEDLKKGEIKVTVIATGF
jgi:cell division protein FtsZ